MENEKTILRADIRRTPKKIIALFVIWYIIVAIAFYIGTFGMSYSEVSYDGDIEKSYWLFFIPFYYYSKSVADCYTNGVSIYEDSKAHTICMLALGILAVAFVIALPFIVNTIVNAIGKSMAKQCSLSLTDKGVTGRKKSLFSAKEVKLPIDKVDAIMASHSFWDTLRGGDTLLIRSASGVVKFPWVQNSKEFVDATLAKIEEFKQSVKDENQNLVSAMAKSIGGNTGNSSSAQKIKELKELLDSGLITQEEFEAKRKELLDKM